MRWPLPQRRARKCLWNHRHHRHQRHPRRPPVGIAARVTQYEIKWGAMSAAGVVAMIPVLVFAAAVQKYLVRGLSQGAVRG
jgi:ABC-type glycerol-3-phosphate transport system permease component